MQANTTLRERLPMGLLYHNFKYLKASQWENGSHEHMKGGLAALFPKYYFWAAHL